MAAKTNYVTFQVQSQSHTSRNGYRFNTRYVPSILSISPAGFVKGKATFLLLKNMLIVFFYFFELLE